MRILVTGASGYVGGRLVPRLLDAGHEVRCVARSPEKLSLHPWRHSVEVVKGDALDSTSIKEAASDCDAAVYLIHSMAAGRSYADLDRKAALNFSAAADAAGLKRIVYLGGLGSDDAPHLRSRHEVGEILASGSTPVTEIRASVIIGSGSLSFEMLRSVTESMPFMATPRWTRTKCQPVAVRDVLDTLCAALEEGEGDHRVEEIGGPDVLTYQQMIRTYAREAGLRRRRMIPLPFTGLRASAMWLGLVTPLPQSVVRPLVENLSSDAVVTNPQQVSDLEPMPFRTALRRALSRLPGGVITRWSDAESQPATPPDDPDWSGGTVYMDRQVMPTDTQPTHIYWAFSRIGGEVGYYGLNWAWQIRGFLDRLVGGVGLRRGRRHPHEVRIGEAIDCWRVDDVEPGRSMRLRSEMRVPGQAWLEWDIQEGEMGFDLIQTAWFRPRGVVGRLYWYGMLIPHRIVFPRMAHRIAAAAEERGFSSR
jgi:uncharacterized protein YbjT (DUF2867 family)